MFQDFLESTKILIVGCDIIYGLMGAVVDVIFNKKFFSIEYVLSWVFLSLCLVFIRIDSGICHFNWPNRIFLTRLAFTE